METPTNRPDDLVSIARFRSALGARLARARLEVEGIPCFLSHEFSGGSVELRVPAASAEEAIALLETANTLPPQAESASQSDSPNETRCLVCQSSFVTDEPMAWPRRIVRSLLAALSPLPADLLRNRTKHCGVCGYRWKETHEPLTRPPGIG